MFSSSDFEDLRDYPVALLGPLLNGYFAALYGRLESAPAASVAFVSREGVFLNEAFQAFCDARGLVCRSAAVPASRAFLAKLLLDDGSLDHVLTKTFEGTFARLLADRLAISDWTSEPDMVKWSKMRFVLPRDADQIRSLWPYVKDRLNLSIAEKKQAYRAHLTALGVDERSIVADVGYSGSIQALLSWIMEAPLSGFYIATTKSQKIYNPYFSASLDALFPSLGNLGDGVPMLDNSLLLEVVMSADHGQVDDILPSASCDGWRFHHGPKGRSQYAHDVIKIMQDAVISHLRDTSDAKIEQFVGKNHRDWLHQYVDRMMTMPSMAPRLLIEVGDVDDRASGLGFINPWRYLQSFQ